MHVCSRWQRAKRSRRREQWGPRERRQGRSHVASLLLYIPRVPRDRCISDANRFHYRLPPQPELAHWPIFQARSRTVGEVGELRYDLRHRKQIAK